MITSLSENPRPTGVIKLEDDIYRLRIGRYRVVYHIVDGNQTVTIGSVQKRTERTYRRIRDLF